jgi:hypothetical protein
MSHVRIVLMSRRLWGRSMSASMASVLTLPMAMLISGLPCFVLSHLF